MIVVGTPFIVWSNMVYKLCKYMVYNYCNDIVYTA